MYTKSTSQDVVDLGDEYIGIPETRETLQDFSIFELSKKLVDDIALRRFFILKRFSDHFKKDDSKKERSSREAWFYNFVRTTLLFPAIHKSFAVGEVFYFFNPINEDVKDIFNQELKRNVNDVCKKAERIGIFKQHTFMAHRGEEARLLSKGSSMPEEYYMSAIFYKISPALIDFWIKGEKKGSMLELWIYELLKLYIVEKDFKVFYNMQVRAKSEPIEDSVIKFVEESTKTAPQDNICDIPYTDDITEFDSVIAHDSQVKVAIECKITARWEDVIKLFGGLKLLKIPYGILISGNSVNAFKSTTQFKNIKIFNGALDETGFPRSLKNYLDEILTENDEKSN